MALLRSRRTSQVCCSRFASTTRAGQRKI
jgi:hypothetical protein